MKADEMSGARSTCLWGDKYINDATLVIQTETKKSVCSLKARREDDIKIGFEGFAAVNINVTWASHSLAMKMKTVGSSETSVRIYSIYWLSIPGAIEHDI